MAIARSVLISTALMCLAFSATFARQIVELVDWGLRTIGEVFARPTRLLDAVRNELAPAGGPLNYAGPSSFHELRHEAGATRRSADRNI